MNLWGGNMEPLFMSDEWRQPGADKIYQSVCDFDLSNNILHFKIFHIKKCSTFHIFDQNKPWNVFFFDNLAHAL